MPTTVTEIADGIYRISTWIPDVTPDGFTFNQFLVAGEEPLLFHTGPRGMFPLVAEAVATVLPVELIRWITFGHVEADECGAMNMWLKAAPSSQVAHGALGCMVSLNDLCDRPPRALEDGEVIDLGGKRVRQISTPHVPHGWEAQVLFEETTATLLCGDLFTQAGAGPALTTGDVVEPAMAAEGMFHATSLAPHTAQTMRQLGDLNPRNAGDHARQLLPGRRQAGPLRPRGRLREVHRRQLSRRFAVGGDAELGAGSAGPQSSARRSPTARPEARRHRGRCSVSRPGVIVTIQPPSPLSAVCHTPGGLISAWPAEISTARSPSSNSCTKR